MNAARFAEHKDMKRSLGIALGLAAVVALAHPAAAAQQATHAKPQPVVVNGDSAAAPVIARDPSVAFADGRSARSGMVSDGQGPSSANVSDGRTARGKDVFDGRASASNVTIGKQQGSPSVTDGRSAASPLVSDGSAAESPNVTDLSR